MQPTPPPPPAPPAIPGGATFAIPGVEGASPAAVYRAAQAQVRELKNQLSRLEGRHRELSREIRNTPFSEGGLRKGLEGRLADVDARIVEVEKQIAVAEGRVAQVAGMPGAVQPERPPQRQGPPEEVFIIPALFIMFILFPLTIAYARRIWRRGAVAVSAIPTELMERMSRLETAVDSVALEVERIGEGQRFVSKLFAEGGARHLNVGAGPVPEVEEREAVPVGGGRARQ